MGFPFVWNDMMERKEEQTESKECLKMRQWQEITTLEEWMKVLKESDHQPVLIMKHSTRCNVSADAWQECQELAQEEVVTDVTLVMVKVVESREVSNRIAEDLQVKHASPQTILIRNQQTIWDTSHWHIKKETLCEVLKENKNE